MFYSAPVCQAEETVPKRKGMAPAFTGFRTEGFQSRSKLYLEVRRARWWSQRLK